MNLSSGKIRELDALHREVLVLKERRCWICGNSETLQVSHIMSRCHLSTRWDTEPDGNCHRLCDKCHRAAHQIPGWYEGCFERRIGLRKAEMLRERSRNKPPFGHIEDTGVRLRDELSFLMNSIAKK